MKAADCRKGKGSLTYGYTEKKEQWQALLALYRTLLYEDQGLF